MSFNGGLEHRHVHIIDHPSAPKQTTSQQSMSDRICLTKCMNISVFVSASKYPLLRSKRNDRHVKAIK